MIQFLVILLRPKLLVAVNQIFVDGARHGMHVHLIGLHKLVYDEALEWSWEIEDSIAAY